MTTTLALSFGCSSSTVPDAGDTPDASARPDAAPGRDAAPAADAPPANPDAGAPDAAEQPDADEPDATTPDADVDAGPPDPCGPVARARSPERLATAVGAWFARCNPELTADEAIALGTLLSGTASVALTDAQYTYDATSAGACGCAIEAAPCELLRNFRAIPSCDAALVSTATTGDACASDFDCPSAHACVQDAVETAFGRGPPIGICGGGTCVPMLDVGDDCSQEGVCRPGTFCRFDKISTECQANALLGEDCSDRPCSGDYEDVLALPPNECVFTKADVTCRARGRGPNTCNGGGSCHDLYRCEQSGDCVLAAGSGQACPTPFDVAIPTYSEQRDLIDAASWTCRIPAIRELGGGYWCTQTGTTTGQAECRRMPLLGEPCGIGEDLAYACAGDAYCPGIDEYTLAPISSRCAPRLSEGSTCTPSLFSLNDPCSGTTRCFSDGKSPPACTDICLGFPR